MPHQGPKATSGLRQVRVWPPERRETLPARPATGPAYSLQAAAVSDATSTFTPGPMEELTAAFFR